MVLDGFSFRGRLLEGAGHDTVLVLEVEEIIGGIVKAELVDALPEAVAEVDTSFLR